MIHVVDDASRGVLKARAAVDDDARRGVLMTCRRHGTMTTRVVAEFLPIIFM